MRLHSGPHAWRVGVCNQLHLLPSERKGHLGPSEVPTCALEPWARAGPFMAWVSFWIVIRGWNYSCCCFFDSLLLPPAQCPLWGNIPALAEGAPVSDMVKVLEWRTGLKQWTDSALVILMWDEGTQGRLYGCKPWERQEEGEQKVGIWPHPTPGLTPSLAALRSSCSGWASKRWPPQSPSLCPAPAWGLWVVGSSMPGKVPISWGQEQSCTEVCSPSASFGGLL